MESKVRHVEALARSRLFQRIESDMYWVITVLGGFTRHCEPRRDWFMRQLPRHVHRCMHPSSCPTSCSPCAAP
eukprot:4534774-Pyramimonas_sp.AAC.2